MAKYKVTKPCFIHGKLNRVGDTIRFEGDPPSYLKAIEVARPVDIEKPVKPKKKRK